MILIIGSESTFTTLLIKCWR